MHDQNWYEVEARHAALCIARIIANDVASESFAGAAMPADDDTECSNAQYWRAYQSAQARALEVARGELRPVEPALAAAIAAAYAAARRVV